MNAIYFYRSALPIFFLINRSWNPIDEFYLSSFFSYSAKIDTVQIKMKKKTLLQHLNYYFNSLAFPLNIIYVTSIFGKRNVEYYSYSAIDNQQHAIKGNIYKNPIQLAIRGEAPYLHLSIDHYIKKMIVCSDMCNPCMSLSLVNLHGLGYLSYFF